MVDKHHPAMRHIGKELASVLPSSVILDIGTSARFAKEMSYFQRLLINAQYFALGYGAASTRQKNHCDVDGDAHSLPFTSSTADILICLEVIEHVQNPYQVMSELHRVLKPGGKLILTTPFLLPFHGKGELLNRNDHDSYPDFWRFTHQGLQLLCKDYANTKIIPFSSTYGYYIKMLLDILHLSFISEWIHKTPLAGRLSRLGNPTYRHLVIARK